MGNHRPSRATCRVQRGHAAARRSACATSAAGRLAGCRGITAVQVHQSTACPLTRFSYQHGLQQGALYHRGRVVSRGGNALPSGTAAAHAPDATSACARLEPPAAPCVDHRATTTRYSLHCIGRACALSAARFPRQVASWCHGTVRNSRAQRGLAIANTRLPERCGGSVT